MCTLTSEASVWCTSSCMQYLQACTHYIQRLMAWHSVLLRVSAVLVWNGRCWAILLGVAPKPDAPSLLPAHPAATESRPPFFIVIIIITFKHFMPSLIKQCTVPATILTALDHQRASARKQHVAHASELPGKQPASTLCQICIQHVGIGQARNMLSLKLCCLRLC